MKKKILIIGSKGMAGHIIYYYFKELPNFEVIDISRSNKVFNSSYILDVNDTLELEKIIYKEKPCIVINCIGILNKDAEDNPDKAIFLNSYLPHFLAKLGSKLNFKLIHISTDCVFNGKKGSYKEDDIKDGFGIYAQSKALGEVNYGNHLTIRTSIIGPEINNNGIGLFNWFMHQNGEIKGFRNVIWSGVTTIELAKAIEKMIDQNIIGLYQLVNYPINKFDLLLLFKQIFSKQNINLVAFDDYYANKSLISTRNDFTYNVCNYLTMMEEMKEWMSFHVNLYPHYFHLS